jgi:acetylornithine deacetylase/succinyl-diaminopimelate desuccinylase-like protein
LLRNLIRFDTTNPPGNEAACIAYLGDLLAGAGCETTLLARSPERPNLISRLRGQGAAAPLLLYGHADVVTAENQRWQQPPFEGNLVDGWVWGRGALDMKGGLAMMLAAFLRAKLALSPDAIGVEGTDDRPLPGDVVLAIVSDEEAGGDYGARYLVENHADLFEGVRYAIGEFGGFTFHFGGRRFYPIMVAEKGACWLRATVRGSGGHGSLSGRASAVARLGRLLEQLERRSLPVHITPVARQMCQALSRSLPFPSSLLVRQLLNPRLTHWVLNRLGEKGLAFLPLFHNTVNPTMVRGGAQVNVAPSEVVLDLDCRLLPGYSPADLVAEVRQVVGDEVELELVQHDPGPAAPFNGRAAPDMGLFDTLSDVLREADPQGIPIPTLLPATTDARFFSRLGIQTYGFLPMALPPGFNFWETIHGPDERIPIEALDFGAEAIYQLLHRFGSK